MRPTHVRYGVVAFAVSLAVITYLDRVCISFAAPAIRRDLGLTAIRMGWAFTAAATGWAWSHASLVATRFLFGTGEAGCFPNLTKAYTTWLPPGERVQIGRAH